VTANDNVTKPGDVRCERCHRPLKDTDSRARGYGPVCADIVLGIDTHRTPVPRSVRTPTPAVEQLALDGFPKPPAIPEGPVPVDTVNALIGERLEQFQKLDAQTTKAIEAGAKEPPASFAYMLRNFVEATYLAVLTQVKPDLAAATAAWIKDATEAADGTVPEVVHDWRRQLAAGDTLWLPGSIIEQL